MTGYFLVLGASPAGTSPQQFQFNIPSEPLERALDSFGSAGDIEVIYDTALATGRRSAAITGWMTREAAIAQMLRPTDLVAVFGHAGTMTIKPAAKGEMVHPASPLPDAAGPGGPYRPFLAQAQAAIVTVLCRDHVTRPGSWRAELQVWIGAEGRITRVHLVRPSGDVARDQQLVRALLGTVVGSAPPHFPQPLMMSVLPDASAMGAECSTTR